MSVHDFYRLSTAADLDLEPDDGLRRELHDGVIYVVPPPGAGHSWEVRICDRALSVNAPDDVYILQNVGVHTGLRRLFVPDLTVVSGDTPFHENGFDPGGVLLVIEVVSPSSVALDRITKPAIYAEQGIPYFWRVDDGPRLQCYQLSAVSGEYVLRTDLGPGEKGPAAAPWPVEIDATDLIMPHKR